MHVCARRGQRMHTSHTARCSVIDGLGGGVAVALVHLVDVGQGLLGQVDVERRQVLLRAQTRM